MVNRVFARCRPAACCLLLGTVLPAQDELPPVRADLEREARYYRIVDVPTPPTFVVEASSFCELKGGKIAVGTRRGDVFLVEGLTADEPKPVWHRFARGMHEVLGLAFRDDRLYATQQAEVTRLIDRDGDLVADRYETVSDAWGFGGEHEFTFGSDFDRDGYLWVTLCLTGSYTSENPFRGWVLRIAPDGTTLPSCSGLRSPGGVAVLPSGEVFYTESQGPWNGTCSLKRLTVGAFMGHPISNKWYERVPELERPAEPTGGRQGRTHLDARRIPQLEPPAVWFPYKKTSQSASAICPDISQGRFGPFAGQLFVADYTLCLVMRVDLEQVEGQWQGACYPFREGFATGLIGGILTRSGHLLVGGSARGWPTRSTTPYALQRLEWTGAVPFEVLTMRARSDGFELTFTRDVDPGAAGDASSYSMESYTYYYHKAYGSPEVDRERPAIRAAEVSGDRRSVRLRVDGLREGHVHELHLPGVRSAAGETLLHPVAYYTLQRLPRR